MAREAHPPGRRLRLQVSAHDGRRHSRRPDRPVELPGLCAEVRRGDSAGAGTGVPPDDHFRRRDPDARLHPDAALRGPVAVYRDMGSAADRRGRPSEQCPALRPARSAPRRALVPPLDLPHRHGAARHDDGRPPARHGASTARPGGPSARSGSWSLARAMRAR